MSYSRKWKLGKPFTIAGWKKDEWDDFESGHYGPAPQTYPFHRYAIFIVFHNDSESAKV